ncbi:MAG TPA: N-6 DNA methylase [Aggregatilineaceae bacterium]|nr:N-6 DNA methylase [Aggregatilineaceae bacterium]
MSVSENEARYALQKLLDDYNRLSADDRAQMTEASVVRQFIDRLLRDVLGWPIEDPQRYKYELATQAGRPDITLIPEAGGTIFVEAKRFGVIKELAEARRTIAGVITPGQMALPGMAVDRTEEEQQAINYAFANGGTWAILTNFEKLRLFNARRDWLVLSFEKPVAYRDEFEQLWQLAYPNILNGSLDRLSNQRYTRDIDTQYLAFINEWREKLAQDIVQRRDNNPWTYNPDGSINLPVLRAVVQGFLDRLVVVRFAEDHLVITPGTLRQYYDLCLGNPYTFTMDEFLDRFFRRFDTEHNSALFAEGLIDQASFSNDALMPLIGKLYEARYRSMPADIIGNTYEQYLGKALALDNGSVTTRDNLETRKKQGSYYTPQVIVRYLVDTTLGRHLYGTTNGQPNGEPAEGETPKTSRDIRHLRILDSACGSGSFLIYAYYVLADFYQSEIERLQAELEARNLELAAQGVNPMERRLELADYTVELERIGDYPRLILETHLYGVDLDPQAAEIAVVNLIMRAMERRHEKRLPQILNQNVKVGNGLIGLRYDDPHLEPHRDLIAQLRHLRLNMIRIPNGPEHKQIRTDLENLTASLNATLNVNFEPYFSDLDRAHPFHWGVEFPEVFFDKNGQLLNNPGFTIIIGNPPWEILKPDLREFYAQFDPDIESKLNRQQVERRIEQLQAEDPRRVDLWKATTRTIEETAAYVRQSPDYPRQGKGDTATHKLFLERMYSLLQDRGRLGYLIPSGIYTDLGTKGLREMLLNEGNIQYIYSFSNERFFFPGVHHSFKFVLLGAQKGPETDGFWAAFCFNPRVAVAPGDLPAFLANLDNLIYIQRESLKRFNPDSLSFMEFQSQQDATITEKLYANVPLLSDHQENTWNARLNREFDMTNDRHLFITMPGAIPVYNGRMIHQFISDYAPHEFWIAENLIPQVSEATLEQIRQFRIGYRRIARPTDERTLIAAIISPNTICDTVAIVAGDQSIFALLYLCGVFNSLCLDFVLRQKIATTVNMFYVYSLPVPRLTRNNPFFNAIVPRAARLTCTRSDFADLWHGVMGSEWDVSKGATDPTERQRLRDEIDAIVAHLYSLSRADFDHILSTFPLVFPDTDEGRKKRLRILDMYDDISRILSSYQ